MWVSRSYSVMESQHAGFYTDESLVASAQLSYQYISDQFLPDNAIDLIDEAGSRVRLRHAQLPEKAKELEKELRLITKEKNDAVRLLDGRDDYRVPATSARMSYICMQPQTTSAATSNLPLPDAFLDFLNENGIDLSIYTAVYSNPHYIRLKPGCETQLEEIEADIKFKLEKVDWLPNFYSFPPHIQITNSKAYQEGKVLLKIFYRSKLGWLMQL